jgi:hypothetical protein
MDRNSPVQSFTEKLASRSSLAQYQYFSDREISDLTNDPMHPAAVVRFYGQDVLDGPVHSNGDIFIRQIGGGDNLGWPRFNAKVTTAGIIQVMTSATSWGPLNPNAHPVDRIFQGGYEENVPPIWYDPDASLVMQHGLKPFGVLPDGNDIFFCEIEGTTVNMKTAQFLTRTEEFIVYSSYPDALHPNVPIGDSLWTNVIAIPDTLWTNAGSVGLAGTSMYLPSTVWVKGMVSGRMTIASKKDSYIIGNITYARTNIGTPPDDFANNNVNPTDYFGLVSEGKIIIKYKYKDPDTGATIFAPMSVGPNGNIYLYGAFSAQGMADPSLGSHGWRAEGTFTYEYQHPHGSPRPFWGVKDGAPFYFDNIAFHRFKFPPDPHNSAGPYWRRWPGVVPNKNENGFSAVNRPAAQHYYSIYDYPWINPNYPERHAGLSPANPATDITYLRGRLWVYGSIAQRRRGFVRRSGNNSIDNPDTEDWWDVANFVFGGQHHDTGYDKRYFWDSRFLYVQPPHYPEVYQGSQAGKLSAFSDTAWNFLAPPTHWPH